jgi:hypothetical protein
MDVLCYLKSYYLYGTGNTYRCVLKQAQVQKQATYSIEQCIKLPWNPRTFPMSTTPEEKKVPVPDMVPYQTYRIIKTTFLIFK